MICMVIIKYFLIPLITDPDCYKLVFMGDMISPTAVSKINTTVNVTVTTISTEDEPNSA